MDLKALGITSPADIPHFDPPREPLGPIRDVLRTPDARFAAIKDFPYTPRYVTSRVHGVVRIHYVTDGPPDSKEVILLMHGEPTWCYLYRKMIPRLAAAGYRVVAPDLVGFGRSDKPAQQSDYSYERQVDWMADFVVAAGLNNVTMFCQDCNTGLPTGGGQASVTFKVWASIVSQKLPDWGMILAAGTVRGLSDVALDAYRAPFPSEEFKAASRVYPRLVPQTDEHHSVEENKGAWRRVFQRWKRPLLTLFADSDAVSRGGETPWIQACPGAKGQKHAIIKNAGHFLQEDASPELCDRILAFIKDNPMDPNPPFASFSSKL